MDEERRWGWLAVLLGACALLTAAACALASVWVAGGLFAAIGLGMLDVGWIRLHSRR
jgi:hypothetical protein